MFNEQTLTTSLIKTAKLFNFQSYTFLASDTQLKKKVGEWYLNYMNLRTK